MVVLLCIVLMIIPAMAGGPEWTLNTSWSAPDVGSSSSAAFADLDGDGDYDLMIGAVSGVTYGYENTGSSSGPEWTAKSSWNTPDIGSVASPAFADLDGDGDYDLMIGASDGITYGYENTGSPGSPEWTAKSSWNTLDIGSASKPAFADLDGDGDYDLMIGISTGFTYGYENTGSPGSPEWTAKSEWDSPDDIGSTSNPTLTDLDGDGDYDLMIGESQGVAYGYENTGSSGSPEWTAKSEWDSPDVGNSAAPALADLDGDGDYDLMIGASDGITYGYENTGTMGVMAPVAGFSVSPTSGDAPLTVHFTDESTNDPTEWSWDFGDGDTTNSTEQNPIHTYATSGTYSVTLIATNSAGDGTKLETDYITVTNAVTPVAAFSAESTSGNVPLTVKFNDLSENSPTSWLWDFGDGDSTNATKKNPVHTYATAGTYDVSLTATNLAGSGINVATSYITVTDVIPVANFSAEPTSGYSPLTVIFTDESTGYPTLWSWDFGDGDTTNSTEPNPVHTYAEAGTYSVTLTTTNSAGDGIESKTDYITVTDLVAPVADFSAETISGNVPLTVQFNDLSENLPTSWSWDFGDGDTTNSTQHNPIHTYIASGTYSVTLTATNIAGNGVESKTDYITVESLVPGESAPVASFTTNSSLGRVPFTVQLTDTTTGNVTSWYWDFGDGGNSTEQSPVHTYVTEGTQTATLSATGPGGTTKATVTMTVDAPLNTGSYNGGVPLTTVQEGIVSGGLWYDSWPGFGTYAEKTFTLPDYKEIKWARLYACVYSSSMDGTTSFSMTMDIDADGEEGYEIQENEAYSVDYSGVPAWLNDHVNRVTSDYFMWYDLTDAINGSEVNVKATGGGSDGRIKHITLVVAYDDGDEDKIYYWVNQGHDSANYNYDNYIGSTKFSTSSLSGFDTANLTSIYAASVDGVYTFNEESLSSGSPVLSGGYFGYDDWNVTGYLNSGQDSTFEYTKSDSGTFYKIQLALLTVSGAESSGGTAPGTDFSANVTSGAPPLTVKFTDESTGSPNSWSWDFGDGETSDEQNPVHTFGASGYYTVTLTAGNSYGTNTEEKSSYISVLRAGTDISITESVVPLVSSAVFAREPNTVRILSLKNGGNETVTDIEIDLYASDVFGPVNRTTVASLESGEALQVQIIDPTIRESEGSTIVYTAVVDPDNKIPEVDETNNNKSGPAKPVKYNGYKGKALYWEDGSNITTKYTYELNGDIIHSFGNSSYVSGSAGGSSWLSHTVDWTAEDLPVPDDSKVVAARLYIPYTWDNSYQVPYNISVTFNGNDTSYDYLDTDVSNFGAYSDFYYGLLSYDVTDLYEKNSKNSATFTRSEGDAKLSLYGFTLAVIYENSTSTRKQIFINEGFDLLGASLTSYGTTPEESTAWVEFSGMDINVSNVDSTKLITFVPAGAGWDNNPGEGNLIVNGETVAEYVWDYSGGSGAVVGEGGGGQVAVDTRDIRSNLLSSGNVIGIQSYPDSNSPCMAASQQFLVIDYGIVPEANFTASPVDGNVPFDVKFTDNSTAGATSYEWDFGDGGNSTEQNPTHKYTYPGTYSVRLNVSNENGTTTCLAERLINAAWPSIPSAGFSSNVSVGKSPLAVNFTDRSTNSPTSWLWEFGDGSTSTEQNPSHTYTAARLYTVNLTAYNSDGNSTVTKPGYVEVVDIPELPGYNDIYVKTANAPAYDKQANGTYYIGTCENGGGLSDLHISTSPDSPDGSTYLTANRTGEFYVTYTGDRGFQDDIILLLAVNGTVPDDFSLDMSASGNKWTPSDTGEKPENIASSSINRAFAKADFTYGLQDWKPAAGNQDYPLFSGEDMNETCNTFRVMFIDLKSGVLSGALGLDYADTKNNGSIRVDYSFTNLTSFATFNVYGWNQNNSGQQAIIDTNSVSSGYSVYIAPVSEDNGIVPDFNVSTTSGEIPLSVAFTDLTSVTPTSRLWEFGDGANSTEENPSHTYTMPGVYSVNLTISNSKGTNNTLKVNYISVNNTAPPAADFTSDKTSGMEPLTVKFTDNSTGNITSWKWEFGDGGTSIEQSPSHTYNDAGNYSVRLTVKNSRGTDNILKRNYIAVAKLSGESPAADFGLVPATGSAPLVVVFTDKSANTPTSWKWDFENDGIIDSTAQNPSYTYRNTGTYSVALTVSNKFGSDMVVKENAITISGVKNSSKTATISNSGTLTENSDGSREYSINTSDAGISGNDIVINSGNCVITIKSDKTPVENGGSYVSSNVTGIELKTDPVETTMDSVGSVSGSVNVSLNGIPGSASLEVILDEGDSGVGTAFQLAAGSSGLDVSKVAYTMNILKTNLKNGQDVKEARITMSVPVSWVDANGGISSIKIIRIAEDGMKEVLNTTYIGMSGGLMVFEGYSPNGLSLFGLAATEENSSGTVSSSDSSGSDRIVTSRGRLDYKNSENPSEVQSSEEGKVLADTTVPSDDGLVAVFLSKGTLALDKSGNSIDEIVIEKSDEDSVPENEDSPVYEFMGRAYDFKPSGATFSPGIDIIFYLSSLGEYQAFDGREPVIRYYNKAGKKWEDLKTTFDEDTMTVSATASHFSIYGLFAASETGLSGEQDASAEQTSNAATQEGTAAPINSQTGASSASSAILVLFTVGFVSVVSLGTYRFRKSRMEEVVFGEEE
ncbi:PKD domain-containing protein [Methanolacinia petrolearia]|nr:PKD domain-containing protein [Methanolacinia petrolearia]